MKNWLISLISVTILGYFIKILLPEGKNKNLVLFVISVLCIVTIITPILNFSNSDFQLNLNFENGINIDTSFLEYTESCREKYYLTLSNTKLKNYLTINRANFIFDSNLSGNPLKKIEINFSDIVINQNNEHINISLIIKENLSELFSISKECVIINGLIS